MNDTLRRAVLILGVLAVLVGVGVADAGRSAGTGPSTKQTAALDAASRSGTAMTRGGVESSAWFCAGGTGSGGDAQAVLLLTNPTGRTVTGTLTTVASGTNLTSGPQSTPLSVPPHSQIGTVPAPQATGGAVASTVVLDGGGVGVSQVTSGPLGLTTAPCASATSSHWYFADASTAQGSTLTLSLFNPTDTIAVVDVSFVSASGVTAPPAYQGIDVPGDSLVVENVGVHVQDDPAFATEVTTLSGAVVAAETEAAGQSGDGGPSILLGASTPSASWSFAQNTSVANGATVFHVFNPSSRPARVTVRIGLQQGVAEPLQLRIPALSVARLEAQSVTRIPSGSVFAVTFASGGGAGIVVDRHVSAPAGATAPQQGDTAGVPGGDDLWLLPAAYAPAMSASTFAVVDPGRTAVTVRIVNPSRGRPELLPGFGRRRLRPGLPLIVSLPAGSTIGSVPLELESSGPVAVEVDALPAGSPGITVIPVLPER